MELQAITYNVVDTFYKLNSWNLLSVVVLLLYIYWQRSPHPKFPPGPKGVPLLGVVPFLSNQPARDFKKWSLKYGPIMSVRLGTKSVVVLYNFNTITQAFVKQGNTFSDRPWIDFFCRLTKHHGIIFKTYGEHFKAQKHFALKFVRDFVITRGLGKKKMEEIINSEGDIFVEYLLKLQNLNNQVNLQHNLYHCTSNIISQAIFGARADYGDPSYSKLLNTMIMLFSDPVHATRQSLLFIWNSFAKLPYFSATMKAFESNMEYILSIMQEKINEHKSRYDPENIEDFIDAFLHEQRSGKQPDKQGFTDVQLTTVCRDFFVAGTETSSTTLSWLFVLYINYPQYQKIIDKEIADVLGSSGIPTMTKRSEMPFTCAFMQEVKRYRSPVPLTQHRTTTEVELQGFVIPKGTTVIGNLRGAHTDPDDWPNPDEFDPRRHIDENGQFVHSNKIIPFGTGSRFCLGESLARVEIFMFFVKILQKFHVSSARDYLPPFDNEIVSAINAPLECVVTLKVRS